MPTTDEPPAESGYAHRNHVRAAAIMTLIAAACAVAALGGESGGSDAAASPGAPMTSRPGVTSERDASSERAASTAPATAHVSPSPVEPPITRAAVAAGLAELLRAELVEIGVESEAIDARTAHIADCMVDGFFDEASPATLASIASADADADIGDYELIITSAEECADARD